MLWSLDLSFFEWHCEKFKELCLSSRFMRILNDFTAASRHGIRSDYDLAYEEQATSSKSAYARCRDTATWQFTTELCRGWLGLE